MTKVIAAITTSVDGYVAGPDDRAGQGLGEGGERLHYWVFGGPWTYADEDNLGEATGEDAAWLAEAMERIGAVVGGRWTYEAANHWGTRTRGGCRSSSSPTVRRKSRRAERSRSSRVSRTPWSVPGPLPETRT